ncbi:nicotinate-nucleotide adenylyltransferase [Buchnera aphidicola (Aphis craccivore)]|uniref:Probable nicotinate-nucleotide adenylyltransferase n=1 Tax=Buchnera aphidicola (Aphis craccivora) TaxID=466616 RepID=A0AA95J0L2_9GAMM|nr:nicotinate-nucleotide adenylyltransferase [Buchnera aphidicola]QLL40807.1 nicotinate-nucleotide adenylyltransferase [Buchnera aphidicola (Aphis craccivore)]WAI17649.1 MAG: nicotinate-nucleotide adenylyltransferase [Buchnera aphidicola (Aphis craccivora)]
MKEIYAILGGNFDPIHYGHILSAEKLAKEISIKKIILLPNQNPPHRSKTKTPLKHKLKMMEYAIKNNNLFEISLLETKKKIFYTVETLKKIRSKIGFAKSLCFIIGEDNLNNLNFWKNWKEILLYVHLLILPRNGIKKYDNELKKWVSLHTIKNKIHLHKKSFGYIFFSSIPSIKISSTQIRKNFADGKSSRKFIPIEVEKYIFLKNLY